jgi:hypothetical protein
MGANGWYMGMARGFVFGEASNRVNGAVMNYIMCWMISRLCNFGIVVFGHIAYIDGRES